jgi:hypothetical protein
VYSSLDTSNSSASIFGQVLLVIVWQAGMFCQAGHYRYLLLNGFPDPLEDAILAVRQCTWFVHEGAPAHFGRVVRDVLNGTYHNRRIGREGRNTYPSRSPDLNPLDFFLWGHLTAHQPTVKVSDSPQLLRDF